MPGPRERAATKQLVNRRKRRNIGLQCRRKYERPGGKYKYQRILMESGKTKSVHMLSSRSSYTRLAYSRSKLLDDNCLVAEVVVEPSIFVEYFLKTLLRFRENKQVKRITRPLHPPRAPSPSPPWEQCKQGASHPRDRNPLAAAMQKFCS